MNAISFANSVLIAGGTLALWALWRQLAGSGDVGPQRLGSSSVWDGRALGYVGVAALFFSSLALRPRPRMVVAQASCSLMAFLYALELVLATTALGPSANVPLWLIDLGTRQNRKEIAALAERSGMTVDTRARGDLLDESRRRGNEIVPAVMLADVLGTGQSSGPAHTDDLLPLGGISSTLTLLCNQGQIVSYASDEHGFRNPTGIWNSPHADIAAVGQSFAQGYCVRDGQGFVDLLRTHRVALNLGTSGQGSLLQLAAIKEYLPRYEPKTVLWIFAEGIDLPDLYLESTHPLARRYLDPSFSQHLLARQPEIDAALRRVVSGVEKRDRGRDALGSRRSLVDQSLPILKLWNLRQKFQLVLGLEREEAQPWSVLEPAVDTVLSDVLAQARSVVSSWGGTLYFVYLPSWDRYRNGPTTAEREHTKVLSVVNELLIPIIDIEPAFRAHDDPLSLFPFRRFGHFNERGNRIVAATILRALSGE